MFVFFFSWFESALAGLGDLMNYIFSLPLNAKAEHLPFTIKKHIESQ
jgi:hypothetical protein